MSWVNDPRWQSLTDAEKAAAMALMEAANPTDARNVLGVMVNRAARDKADIGDQVSSRVYQPTMEASQGARLPQIVGTPEHKALVDAYYSRTSGQTPDWVGGATHFLAPEKTMLALEAKEPDKYQSWRKWTGFDPASGQYGGVVMRDGSHAFLAPEGSYSAEFNPADRIALREPGGTMPQTQGTPSAPSGGGMLASLLSGIGGDEDWSVETDEQGQADSGWDELGGSGNGIKQRMAELSGGVEPGVAPMRGRKRSVDLSSVMRVLQGRRRLGTA